MSRCMDPSDSETSSAMRARSKRGGCLSPVLPDGQFEDTIIRRSLSLHLGSPLAGHQPRLRSATLATKSSVLTVAVASGRRRALVVDDEPTIRSALLRYLRRAGWEAEEAENGRVALGMLGKSGLDGYQVVVSDLRMPHCSGVELHDWLAKHRPDLFSRLIITTGDLASPRWSEFVLRTS